MFKLTQIFLYFQTKSVPKKSDYHFVDIVYSNIINEEQQLSLMQHFENSYVAESERGVFTDVLTDLILPEIMILLCMEKVEVNRIEAIKILNQQAQKRAMKDSKNATY